MPVVKITSAPEKSITSTMRLGRSRSAETKRISLSENHSTSSQKTHRKCVSTSNINIEFDKFFDSLN